ncbi:MAG: uncharacterized protein KVP18_000952 [Porospora cf. gigantea A]|uniref:uncharacterized protein n=1 Tax=Porospora cf. gigantea A TaxID=2853593 RepID=UPI00355A9BE1|nr:MAG: hypothetical protein KVP18_000952 [Porospora cf. gigantea A]
MLMAYLIDIENESLAPLSVVKKYKHQGSSWKTLAKAPSWNAIEKRHMVKGNLADRDRLRRGLGV